MLFDYNSVIGNSNKVSKVYFFFLRKPTFIFLLSKEMKLNEIWQIK